ncbi:MAG: VOC family protein [Candidatus Bathyarchaeota archaeon]|nr:VOC family protein [Candidatus Bathyarchaeota archaeon]MDH5787794.1 VOC family protein [Candidatus Bathyarchaeota archaeon]
MVDHTIAHFEIPANDVEQLRKFYTELFGWKIERWPGPSEYWTISTVPVDEKGEPIRPGVNGGMMKKQNPQHKPTNYILVESVDEYAKKIEDLGGKVVVPKTRVPGICWWALAVDPEGNQFAIMESIT